MHTERNQLRMERVSMRPGGRRGAWYPDREQDDPRAEYPGVPG